MCSAVRTEPEIAACPKPTDDVASPSLSPESTQQLLAQHLTIIEQAGLIAETGALLHAVVDSEAAITRTRQARAEWQAAATPDARRLVVEERRRRYLGRHAADACADLEEARRSWAHAYQPVRGVGHHTARKRCNALIRAIRAALPK